MSQNHPDDARPDQQAATGHDASMAAEADQIAQNAVQAYAELGLIVLNDQPLGAVLRKIADLAVATVPGADEVSVTLRQRGGARSVAFTGQLAVVLDERQYADGFGPCMEAAATGQVISIEDTAHSQAYPGFGRLAHQHGIFQVLSVGMPTAQDTAGSLNVYGAVTTGPFTVQARQIASAFAGYAAVALLNAAIYAGAVAEVTQMHQAMASRAVIEQAKGILMRDRACTAQEAFEFLRDNSSRTNRKLNAVAQEIVTQASGHRPTPPRQEH